MKVRPTPVTILALISLSLPACHNTHAAEQHHEAHHKLVVTSPQAKDVTIPQQYVCQIRAQSYTEVCAQAVGFVSEVPVKEGQEVKKGDVLFRILPVLYQTKLDAEKAKAQGLQLKYNNTNRLYNDKVVSQQEVFLAQAELAEAQANVAKAEAELNFTTVRAPFDGIVDRQLKQLGAKIKEDDTLTTLSDNSVMRAYFNVPEARYFEFKSREGKTTDKSRLKLVDSRIELRLADGRSFPQDAGDIVTVEGKFNNETGNIPFRADFPNPDRLLRHGQTGTVVIHRRLPDAVVIPQRATFEVLDKRYVFVVGEDHVVRQRLITVQNEIDDIFVIKSGLNVDDKIVLEGVQQVHDGEKVEYEFRKPGEVLVNQKNHAE